MNWEPSPSSAPGGAGGSPLVPAAGEPGEPAAPRTSPWSLPRLDGGQFDARAAEALSQMLADMEAQGLSPMVCSSFRTWEDQETLHQNKIGRLLEEGYSQEAAEAEASRWVVPAGASEHQLGLAADIVASQYQILEEEQENTPEQQWLMGPLPGVRLHPALSQGQDGGHRRGLRALALPLRGRGGRPGNHGPGDLPGGIFGTVRKGCCGRNGPGAPMPDRNSGELSWGAWLPFSCGFFPGPGGGRGGGFSSFPGQTPGFSCVF